MIGNEEISPINEEEQIILVTLKERECHTILQNSTKASELLTCPGVWDGILCWPTTPANTTAVQSCPYYIMGFKQNFNASRQCLSDGQWFFDVKRQASWTNFSQCSNGKMTQYFQEFDNSVSNYTQFEDYFPALKCISQVGYTVSLVTLIVAFVILASIKKLHCPRNTLHMHLFVSFVLRAFMTLLKNGLFVHGVGLPSDVLGDEELEYFVINLESNWQCKLVTTLWQLFIMANYSWILMEGLYLHNLIFLALFSDNSSITLYVILGWAERVRNILHKPLNVESCVQGLPPIFIIPWTILRLILENDLCWTTNTSQLIFYLIRGPTGIFMLVNFILFLNIIRVLFLKLRSSICKETRRYRRWAKSTLVLVPLFGVHYTLFIGMSYSIGVNPTVELVWLFCDQLFASFQGFFVAVLYCFLNGEVHTELNKKWHRHRSTWSGANVGGLRLTTCNGNARRETHHSLEHFTDGDHSAGGGRYNTSAFYTSTTCLSAVGKSRAGSMTGSMVVVPPATVTAPHTSILTNDLQR